MLQATTNRIERNPAKTVIRNALFGRCEAMRIPLEPTSEILLINIALDAAACTRSYRSQSFPLTS
jgi:hypothetical protein